MRNYSIPAGWETTRAPGPDYSVESHWIKAGQSARFELPGLTVVNLGRGPTAVFLVARGLLLSNEPIVCGEPAAAASFTQEALF